MNLKHISTLLFAGALFMASCKKEKVNDDILEVPAFSEFGTANLTGRYFVPNSTSSQFRIPVGITNVSNEDRTITFSYSSPTGAVAGTHFTAPTSIVIPAGKALDSLEIHGIYANYPIGRRDSVIVKISGGDVDVNNYNNEYIVILERYCDVVLADLTGSYTQTRYLNSLGGGAVGPFTTTLSAPVSTGAGTGRLTVNSLRLMNLGPAIQPIRLDLTWLDASNFKVDIAPQLTGFNYDVGQPLMIRTSPGQTNTFSSCLQTFTLTVDWIVNNYPVPGQFAFYESDYSVTIRR